MSDLSSAKWGKADLDQVAVTSRNFMNTRPNAQLSASTTAPASGGGGVRARRDRRAATPRGRGGQHSDLDPAAQAPRLNATIGWRSSGALAM